MEAESQLYIQATWQDRQIAGGCNFCTRNTERRVLVVKSKDDMRSVEVRYCPKCFQELVYSGRRQ